MQYLLLAVYLIAGYWATGQTIYRNKILVEFKTGGIFIQRLVMGAVLGWILIPVAIILALFRR